MSGRWRTIVLSIFGVGLAVSISGAEAAAGVLLLAWVGRRIMRLSSSTEERSPLEVPVVIYAIWGVVATALAGGPALEAVRAHSALLLFFIAFKDWTVDDNDTWLTWFCVAAAVSGLIAVTQSALRINRLPFHDELVVPGAFASWPHRLVRGLALRDGRAVGTRSHPLTFAEVLLPAVFLLAAAPPRSLRTKPALRWTAAALVLAGIVLSQARGVWLGLFAGAAALAVVMRRPGVRLAVAAAAVAAVLAVAVVPRLRARALSIVSPTAGDVADRDSRSTRFQIWSAAFAEIREHPIRGAGLDGVVLHVTDPTTGLDRVWTETHDCFLQVAAERGVVGLGLLLWIFALAVLLALRNGGGWRAAGVAILAGLIVAGLTESWIHDK
ncbi:MAG: O-antigen ligase family protein, partial [Elusimicrobia bacterium]|nr:O-antigen ligase family protein [Elusimicrobiota bacterium]